MLYYIYVNTGYERDGMPYRFGCENGIFHYYQDFVTKRNQLMDNGLLIHMDKKTKSGYENTIRSLLENVLRHRYRSGCSISIDDLANNAIFKVNDAEDETLERIIQECRDFHYCHIWRGDPIRSIDSYSFLEETEPSTIIYLDLEAEAG